MDEEVKLWLECLENPGAPARFFGRFMREVVRGDPKVGGMSPRELLDFQSGARGREDRYYIGQRLRHWINGMKLTRKTKGTYYSRIASFFLHRQAPLPPDSSFKWRNSVDPVDGYLPIDDVTRIIGNCNQMYRPIYLMKVQGLLDNKSLIYISDNHAELVIRAITQNVGVFRLPLPPRKNNPNPYFTMLSSQSDFADAFRAYMKTTTNDVFTHLFWVQGDKVRPPTPLREHNIQSYWHRRAVETGVIHEYTPKCPRCGNSTVRRWRTHPKTETRKVCYVCPKCNSVQFSCDMGLEWRRSLCRVRYGKHLHETRDLMSSRWGMSGADRVVREGIMGHRLDPNDYEKFKYQEGYAEREYGKALDHLNIMSTDPNKVDRSQVDSRFEQERVKVEALSREVALLTEKLRVLDDDEVLEALRRVAKKKE